MDREELYSAVHSIRNDLASLLYELDEIEEALVQEIEDAKPKGLPSWTGEIVGEMHVQGITAQELADEMNVTNRYLSMLLNCHRTPADAEERCRAAMERIIKRRGA